MVSLIKPGIITNIALIEPAVSCECLTTEIFAQIRASLPFLAGALKSKGFGCRIYCQELIRLAPKMEHIANSYGAIGISITINTIRQAIEIAQAVKKINPGQIVIFGGSVAGNFADTLLASAGDYCLSGRAEITLPELLNAINSGGESLDKIPNLSYIKNGALIRNEYRLSSADYESDFRAVENFGGTSEIKNILGVNKPPLYSIFTSTGCVRNCKFCASDKKYLKRTIDSVIKDFKLILSLHRGYFSPRFMIVDDCAFGDIGFLTELLEKLCRLRRESKFSIMMQFHAKPLIKNHGLAHLIERAGISTLLIGFESASDASLLNENKGTTVADNIEAIKICRKHNITPYGYFVAGFDTDTRETVNSIFDFILKHRLVAQVLPLGVMKRGANGEPVTDGRETLDPYSFGASIKVSHIPLLIKPFQLQQTLIDGYDKIYSFKRNFGMASARETVYNFFFSLCYRKWRPGLIKHLSYLKLLDKFNR